MKTATRWEGRHLRSVPTSTRAAGTATMLVGELLGFNWAQVFAAVLASLVAVWVARVNRREDELGRAARLTSVSSGMSDGAARSLVNDLRDGLVVEWSLRAQAPRFRGWGALTSILYTAGSALFVLWFLVLALAHGAFWTWGVYAGALVLINTGQFCRIRQLRKRRAWIEQERLWRGLPAVTPESRKRISRDTEKILLDGGS